MVKPERAPLLSVSKSGPKFTTSILYRGGNFQVNSHLRDPFQSESPRHKESRDRYQIRKRESLGKPQGKCVNVKTGPYC